MPRVTSGPGQYLVMAWTMIILLPSPNDRSRKLSSTTPSLVRPKRKVSVVTPGLLWSRLMVDMAERLVCKTASADRFAQWGISRYRCLDNPCIPVKHANSSSREGTRDEEGGSRV